MVSQSPEPWGTSLFAALGRAVVRVRYLIVVLRLVLPFVLVHAFPSLSSLANNNNSAFLPKKAPSLQAAALAHRFQRSFGASVLIVAVHHDGPLTAPISGLIAGSKPPSHAFTASSPCATRVLLPTAARKL